MRVHDSQAHRKMNVTRDHISHILQLNNIKRCMKKAKENWIGEHCCEIEENLRKNNSKRTYQLVKDLTTVKQGKETTVQDHSGKCPLEE